MCKELFLSNETDLLNDALHMFLVFVGFVGGVLVPLNYMYKGSSTPLIANLMIGAGAVGAYMLQKQIRTLDEFDFFTTF